jgi:hypothetical protein
VLLFLIADNRKIANENRILIGQVESVVSHQAARDYQDCLSRNDRATQAMKAFKALVAAHTEDGSLNAAKVWKSYLDNSKQHPLPPCVKPKGGE